MNSFYQQSDKKTPTDSDNLTNVEYRIISQADNLSIPTIL